MLLISITTVFAAGEGGGTSGGGDLKGFDAYKVSDKVFSTIFTIGPKLYTDSQLEMIKAIETELKVIMTDEPLPVQINGQIQRGDAFSKRQGNASTMYLNRSSWESIQTIQEREVLIHHEIMVMAGLEHTGDYSITNKFENIRGQFWKTLEIKDLLCSINVFDVDKVSDRPGKLVGSSTSVMTSAGAKADLGIIGVRSKKIALIWRGIIDTNGFFKLEIDEVKILRNYKNPTTWDIDLGTVKVIEPMKTYFDPYVLDKPLNEPITRGEFYFIAVSCHQL